MMKRIIFLLIVGFLLVGAVPVQAQVVINEVFFDPTGHFIETGSPLLNY